MRIAVAGAGAIGGYIGASLARAGVDVTLFGRGAHFEAMRRRGLIIKSADGDFEVAPRVTSDLAAAGPFEIVILGVKAHSLPALLPQLRPLVAAGAVMVSTQNGIPWWYFQGVGGEFEGLRLEKVDPGGSIAALIPSDRVLGSIVYFSTEVTAPGVITHHSGHRVLLGELDGRPSERSEQLAHVFTAAGIKCIITPKIREEIWLKLLGNASFNPISAVTRTTVREIARHPESARLAGDIMTEVAAVASKLGIELTLSVEQRVAAAERGGDHKTSMLQDVEAGRPTELEPIVGAVVELGARLGIPTLATHAVYACEKLAEDHRDSAAPTAQIDGMRV